MAKTKKTTEQIADQLASKQVQTAIDTESIAPAKTITDALANAVSTLPESVRQKVSDKVVNACRSILGHAHNTLAIGKELLAIAKMSGWPGWAGKAKGRTAWDAIRTQVFYRIAQERTLTTWMQVADTLCTVVPFELAQDALCQALTGYRITTRDDSDRVVFDPALVVILKDNPPKDFRAWDAAIDWASEVQLAYGATPMQSKKQTIGTIAKRTMDLFLVLMHGSSARSKSKVNGNIKLAVSHVVHCYRLLEAANPAYGAATLQGIEDSSVTPDQAGENAMAAFRAAQGTSKVLRRENANTATVRAA